MRRSVVVIVLIVTSSVAVAQENEPKPTISDAPFTNEEIEVYRTVLTTYLKGSGHGLNLANLTEPLDSADTACLSGWGSGVATSADSIIHRIDPSLVADKEIVLVDPGRQQKAIERNDPQNLLMKAIDDHQRLTEEQLDQSLKSAFHSALFTSSEIVFDKGHHRAAVSYRYVCGGLCGYGNTIVLKKAGDSLKVTRRCGGWVS
jgi:hypothetical protein